MRITRLLGVLIIFCVPTLSLALTVPFVGSPFAHMTVFFDNDSADAVSPNAQTAAAAPNPGVNDICYNETVDESTAGAPAETYSSDGNPNFKKCEGPPQVTKADCSNAAKKALVGTVTYQAGFEGGNTTVNRCDKPPSTPPAKCVAIGDSTMVPLTQKGCNAGVSLGGQQTVCDSHADSTALAQSCAFASETAPKVNSLPDGSLQGDKVVIGECSNLSSQCLQNCPGTDCPVSQTIQAAYAKGAASVYVNGVGPGVANSDQINSALQQVAQDNNAVFLGAPSADVMQPDEVHFTNAEYSSILSDIGQITPDTGGPPAATLPGGQYGQMFQTAEQANGLPSGALSQFAAIESGGNPNAISPTGACGLFQYTQSTWAIDSARMNGGTALPFSDCSDPQIATNVTASTLGYYQNAYAAQIQASGLDNTTALYTIHNLGVSGGPAFMTAYAADPNAPVNSAVSAFSISHNSSIYGDGTISLGQAVQNMQSVMGGSTNFVNTATPVVPSPAVTDQPVVPIVNSQPQTTVINTTAPYNPYSLNSGLGGLGGLGGLSLGSSLGNLFGTLFKPSTTQTVATVTPPTASLNVQPQSVQAGQSVGVSWASSNATTCNVTQNNLLVGQGLSGSATISTSSTTPATIQVSLVCSETGSSQVAQQGATVSVGSANI